MRQKKYNGNVEKKQNGVKGKTAALGKAVAVEGNCRQPLIEVGFNGVQLESCLVCVLTVSLSTYM